MEMLDSNYRFLCKVTLPFQDRQRYMHSFDLESPVMAEGFEDYLEPVVSLCRAAGATQGIAHMTVDEKVVQAGMSQRRPKPHVDGCFIPSHGRWGHGPGPGWNHYCNGIAGRAIQRMPIIVAASVSGCRAWRGKFDGSPTEHGDLSHIANQLDAGEVLPPDSGYLLSPDCIHESMVFDQPTKRTFLRIALPTSFDFESVAP
jgi:hypothetical protein